MFSQACVCPSGWVCVVSGPFRGVWPVPGPFGGLEYQGGLYTRGQVYWVYPWYTPHRHWHLVMVQKPTVRNLLECFLVFLFSFLSFLFLIFQVKEISNQHGWDYNFMSRPVDDVSTAVRAYSLQAKVWSKANKIKENFCFRFHFRSLWTDL